MSTFFFFLMLCISPTFNVKISHISHFMENVFDIFIFPAKLLHFKYSCLKFYFSKTIF